MTVAVVSIIIPTYNRAHLIGETLDSILAQTYLNWECIVVDDGSTDNTCQILQNYCENDSRIVYYIRPSNHLPGGNGARNYGLSLAKGNYVIFFDSDDLMTLNHIQTKIKTITKFNLDYVVAKTKFLYDDDDNSLERYYKFTQFNISAHNYITQNINWLTYDALIKSSLAKQISFNEHLQSGQEYNYFSKLVLKSVNAQFISEYLTLRRKHSASKQADLKSNKKLKRRSSFVSTWVTYQEIYQDLSRETKKIILFKIIDYYYNEKKIPKRILFLLKHLYINFSRGRSTFIAMLISEILFSKGYKFRQYFKKQLKY